MKTQRTAAFTLIELLVVIAIIAILAAILFPVFAQAKLAAKKAAAISSYKQTGTAMTIYTSDVDDQYPLGIVPNLASPFVAYKFNTSTPLSPAGWDGNAALAAEDSLVWHNTIQPYMKNYDMLLVPATRELGSATPAPGAVVRPKTVTQAFNGLMQYLSTTAIAAPSKLTMLWPGYGDAATAGTAILTPRLNCNSATGGLCMFNPAGVPQAGATGNPQIFAFTQTAATYYIYGQGSIHTFADTSARYIPYGNGNQGSLPLTANRPVVWNFVNTTTGRIASPAAFRGMGSLRGANYAAAFCPDNTFEN
ncbi:MAG: prepilin-type N-terminal cleavage/methylation domain-containing protein [Armatimonadota bacterium]